MNIKDPTAPIPLAMEVIIQRARSLYSLPVIAAEVIELTNSPKVDARALKDCIEVDPALTAKIMRVVNSSLFGLSREVSDLNQAIALLGTKPLKLLVLGFSLPETLFREVAREQLDWYWSTTLARAVAAREISEQLWDRPGDDAFLAGLLQDIGVLVLLGELKDSYAHFLGKVIELRADLKSLEAESLGFDHMALGAALLKHWNMPDLLVQSISEPREYRSLQRKNTPAAELTRILHLAELLAELVAQNRLRVLPELLEAGKAYCGLDKELLHQLVESLQPKVQQLADVLSLDLREGTDYAAIVTEAHQQMSGIAENIAEPLSRFGITGDQNGESVLDDVAHLRAAVDSFLLSPVSESEDREVAHGAQWVGETEPLAALPAEVAVSDANFLQRGADFPQRLTVAVGRCRSRRQPLSILLLEVSADMDDARHRRVISRVLDEACSDMEGEDVFVETVSQNRRALVLPGYDRQETVRHANAVFRMIDETLERLAVAGVPEDFSASAGIAAVSLPVKNFPPMDLIETAERCLAAARSTGSKIVKSLEIS